MKYERDTVAVAWHLKTHTRTAVHALNVVLKGRLVIDALDCHDLALLAMSRRRRLLIYTSLSQKAACGKKINICIKRTSETRGVCVRTSFIYADHTCSADVKRQRTSYKLNFELFFVGLAWCKIPNRYGTPTDIFNFSYNSAESEFALRAAKFMVSVFRFYI